MQDAGSSYIALPKNIAMKKAIINVQNYDQKCFIWSIIAALFPVDVHPERVLNYYRHNYNDILNLDNISFPTPLSDLITFEKNNNVSINVYGLEYCQKTKDYEVVGPLHYTKHKKSQHINLLYFKNEFQSHYAWIKSLSKLIGNRLSKHKEKKYICDRCLQFFYSEAVLLRHEEDCSQMNAIKIIMPTEENKWLKFKNFQNKTKHPFVIYFDTESLTLPVDTCSPDPDKSYTKIYQKHELCAVALQLVCSYDPTFSEFDSYRGPNASHWFFERLKEIASKIASIYEKIEPVKPLTDTQYNDFNEAKECYICEQLFDANDVKVRDHDHK